MVSISCANNPPKEKIAIKRAKKIASTIIKYISTKEKLVSSLTQLSSLKATQTLDPWGNKFNVDYKQSMVYSPGPDGKHHKLRNNTWNDDIIIYFLIPYFDPPISSHKIDKIKRKRSIAIKNLKIIASAMRDYYREHNTTPKSLDELSEKNIVGIYSVRDPWGSFYSYDAKHKAIFSNGPDQLHNSSKDSTWKDDIRIKFSMTRSTNL
jgi:hypothetical protein